MTYKATAGKPMRPLVIQSLSGSVQKLIRKRAWREHISYERAVVEILTDAEVEAAVQHDLGIVSAWFGEDDDDPF